MCYVWLANLTFTLSRDWIGWARAMLATRLRAQHQRSPSDVGLTEHSLRTHQEVH